MAWSGSTEMLLMDNGLGIFKKIHSELNRLDERHAILETCPNWKQQVYISSEQSEFLQESNTSKLSYSMLKV